MPAMLLLQGGGPTDRDGNQAPRIQSSLMKALADALAARNIVSLRFDKRGMHANATTLPASEAQWSAFFRWESFVGDAVAAYRLLRATPGVDISRIGMIGHSEGGLIALTAAQLLASDRPPASTLVLIATPGRPVQSVMREQLALALLDMKLSPEESETLASASNDIMQAIRETGTVPAAIPTRLVNLYPRYLGPFLRSLLAIDPAAFAWSFDGPVLVVNGSEDRQVSATRDADALQMALAARPGASHAVMIAPDAAHDLTRRGASQPDAATIAAIVEWISRTPGTVPR
ncbi:MAG: alpha/beta fold hydrolase [Alphaproteobacteria bacterium]